MEDVSIIYAHLEYFVAIWFIFPLFGKLYQEKSGNPDPDWKQKSFGHNNLANTEKIQMMHDRDQCFYFFKYFCRKFGGFFYSKQS
jgi:hypothetical protein